MPDDRILSWDNRKLGLDRERRISGVADDDGVRTITIDRPEVKNALTKAMRDAPLRRCSSSAERDAEVRVVVLTAVDPVFTAGVDFKEVAQAGDAAAERARRCSSRTTRAARCGR